MNDRSKCIFCRIADNLENTEIVFSDDEIVVFRDIKPVAKNHFLICPRVHIKDAKNLTPKDKPLGNVEKMYQIGKDVLQQHGSDLNDSLFGFHWPPMTSISHLHLHAISPYSEMKLFHWLQFKPNSYWFVSPEYVLSKL